MKQKVKVVLIVLLILIGFAGLWYGLDKFSTYEIDKKVGAELKEREGSMTTTEFYDDVYYC